MTASSPSSQIKDLIESYDLNNSLILGYYGGGNFGDELLLEIILAYFSQYGLSGIKYMYQNKQVRSLYHHDFSNAVPIYGKVALIGGMLKSRNLIMGGGGHWGMDINLNVTLLCILLFVMRIFARKKVLLLGVGYYSSTSRMGHIAAWFAGKAATTLIARDNESFTNFSKINRRTVRGYDLAFSLAELDESPYRDDIVEIEQHLPRDGQTVLVSYRRFRGDMDNHYRNAIASLINAQTDASYRLTLFEPKLLYPEYYSYLDSIATKYSQQDIQIFDYTYNPVSFYFFYKKRARSLILIAPQYHGQLIAHLAGSLFIPIAYDNKVRELHRDLQIESIAIDTSLYKNINAVIGAKLDS